MSANRADVSLAFKPTYRTRLVLAMVSCQQGNRYSLWHHSMSCVFLTDGQFYTTLNIKILKLIFARTVMRQRRTRLNTTSGFDLCSRPVFATYCHGTKTSNTMSQVKTHGTMAFFFCCCCCSDVFSIRSFVCYFYSQPSVDKYKLIVASPNPVHPLETLVGR